MRSNIAGRAVEEGATAAPGLQPRRQARESAGLHFDGGPGIAVGPRFGRSVGEARDPAHMEKELRALRKELSETRRIARLCSFAWDVRTHALQWSDELFLLAGRDARLFSPTLASTLACVHEEDREKVRRTFLATARDAPESTVEFRILRPDGTVRHLWATCRRELDEQEECGRLVGICQDVTDAKVAEEKLRESEENLRYTVQLSPHIPWMAAPDGSIIDVGPRVFETTGAHREDALGSSWLDMLHPEDVPPTVDIWMHSVRTGEPVETEYRVRSADGSYRWCRATAGSRRDSSGEILRWYGTVEDVHDRKIAENALREAEALNRRILEVSPDAIVLLDDAGRIIFLNPRAADALRQRGDQAPGKPWIEMLPPMLRTDARKALARARKGGSAGFVGEERSEGRSRWWDTTVTPIVDASPGRFLVVSRDVTDHKAAEEQLRWLANHDSLTKLPNRLLLHQRIEEALRGGDRACAPFALLLLDLDDFKRTNDTLGHDAGDALLCAFASGLSAGKRPDDFVARLGGDEFAVVLNGVRTLEEVEQAFERLARSSRKPCVYGGGILECNASVGVSLFPEHGASRSELLKHADIALYAAKADGGNALRVFEPRMRADMQKRFAMLARANDALASGWIEPFYQPKVLLESGKLAGFEALLRWRHPELGIQTPDTIRAAFEDLDLAAQISDRVIDRVIADIRAWLDGGISFGHVAVNAAAAEFRRGDFAESLLGKLAAAGVPPQCFQLEVTETVFLGRGAEHVETALKALSRAGIKIALDDFGTGFASLSHLKRFPVDLIKIDRSFVRDLHYDPDDAAIIEAVIQLGRSLGIGVVAEGIETAAQHDYLVSAGCRIGQGFLYSEAIPAEKVSALQHSPFAS